MKQLIILRLRKVHVHSFRGLLSTKQNACLPLKHKRKVDCSIIIMLTISTIRINKHIINKKTQRDKIVYMYLHVKEFSRQTQSRGVSFSILSHVMLIRSSGSPSLIWCLFIPECVCQYYWHTHSGTNKHHSAINLSWVLKSAYSIKLCVAT